MTLSLTHTTIYTPNIIAQLSADINTLLRWVLLFSIKSLFHSIYGPMPSKYLYWINRLPSPITHMKCHFQLLFIGIPNYNNLRVFGSLFFPWLKPYTSNKLESRSSPCLFLGYSSQHSAYIGLELGTEKIYISRDVHFLEYEFPFKSMSTTSSTSSFMSVKS